MKRSLGILVGLSLLVAFAAFGQQASEQAAPSQEEQAMMEAMLKAATPGEPHKRLEPLVGTFDAKVTMWMAPGAPPMEMTGTAVNEWVLGGRWVQMNFEGSFMGMPFHGIGYTGYDNVQKKYVGTWMDNMSTGVMTSIGTGEATNDSITMLATMADPMTGKMTQTTEKFTIADADHHSMETWGPGPDGKDFKMMEIEYSRKK